MATTFALVLRPPRAKDGLHPVHLRLTSDRQPTYRAIPDVAVSAKHWNEAGTLEKQNWVRGTHPEARRYNDVLRKLLRQVQQLLDENPLWSAKQVRDALDGGGGDDFLAYMQQDIERRRKAGHPRTAEKFASIRSKLQSFCLGIPHPKGRYGLRNESDDIKTQRATVTLPFSQLTLRLIRDYEIYLAGLGNRETTLNKELSFLKTVVLQAIDEDKLPEAKNPFKKIKLKEGKARPKAKLSDEEVARLEALPAEQLTRGELSARDAWLLQYYLLGSRVGDAVCMRWRDVRAEEIFFTEHKTGKAKLSPRSARLNTVLARWAERSDNPNNFVLPYLKTEAPYAQYPAGLTWAELSRLPEYRPLWMQLLRKVESATTSINGNLKRVARLAGIEKTLTSHTARHSFADRGRRRGISASDMRDMLNHHSIAQTEGYYGELESLELTQKARSIFDE
ncbi:tyrosine-type recombinase/integrase [Hymenobacter setariae]|uniref:Tyrosine-type recombinase/integrase n=1 Tax=Hymenobacter setariae TaxID=2594794 RepID=A0A558C2S4_9BACT|nr:site-specific integrase [Hymenobacter setariae]TVT43088.1 tyrosine-type recombinase/integrase [Hymenobacter setariae]